MSRLIQSFIIDNIPKMCNVNSGKRVSHNIISYAFTNAMLYSTSNVSLGRSSMAGTSGRHHAKKMNYATRSKKISTQTLRSMAGPGSGSIKMR